jgi:hypothetical protein
VGIDHRDEIGGLEPRQRREAEARVLREEVLSARVDVGEVAAAAAGDADFLAGLPCVVDDENAAPSPARRQRAEETGAARAENDRVVCQ